MSKIYITLILDYIMFNFSNKNNFQIIFDNSVLDGKYSKSDLNDLKKKVLKYIKIFYSSNVYIHKFKKVEFIFTKNSPGYDSLGFVQNEDISLETIKIFLVVEKFIKNLDEFYFKEKFLETLNHEMVHINHSLHSQSFTRSMNFSKNMLNRIIKFEERGHGDIFYGYRLILSLILSRVYIEGIATFYQEERKYSIEEFEAIYNGVKEEVIHLNLLLVKTIENLKLLNQDGQNLITSIYYTLGTLMTYSILIGKEDIKQEDLFEMGHIKFIKFYEESVLEVNKKYNKKYDILFSYSSGKGIIDYTLLKKLIKKMSKKEN